MTSQVLEHTIWKMFFVCAIATSLLSIVFIPFTIVNIVTCNDNSFFYVTSITKTDAYECNVIMKSDDSTWQTSELMLCEKVPKIGDKVFVQLNRYFGKSTCFQIITDPKNREKVDYKYYESYLYCFISLILLTGALFHSYKTICKIVDEEKKILYGKTKKLCDEV